MIELAQIEMQYQIKYSSQYLRVEVYYTRNQGDKILKIKIYHSYHQWYQWVKLWEKNPSYPNKKGIWARYLVSAIDMSYKIPGKNKVKWWLIFHLIYIFPYQW